MMDEDLRLLIDLHTHQKRQGPGGDHETKKAIELAGLNSSTPLRIADIGCGTGASTLLLAKNLNAQITAVDLLPQFLEVLSQRAAECGLDGKIKCVTGSMEELDFADEELDVIWSEGAIYNMGFEKGVTAWRKFLKPGGTLVVSEITWTTDNRPKEIEDYWKAAYPEVASAREKIEVLEKSGYSLVDYFELPESCWLENYYRPLQNEFSRFLERNTNSKKAIEIVESEKKEIELYETYKNFYSYGIYIARKT